MTNEDLKTNIAALLVSNSLAEVLEGLADFCLDARNNSLVADESQQAHDEALGKIYLVLQSMSDVAARNNL